MLKRRSTWLGGTGALVLVLSLSGVVAAATALTAGAGTAPVAEPLPAVDTTATFEDVDGNGIDDDCQTETAVADQVAVDAELLTVDVNADGIIQTTEAAHSARIGGTNCNHGGYVSWIAHQKHTCASEPADETVDPTDETVEPTDETVEPTEDENTELVVAEPDTTEPDATTPEAGSCDPAIAGAHKDKVAAAAARAASKAERTLAREAAKAERTLVHGTAKAERDAAREAAKAERAAARDAKKAAHAAKHKSH